MGSNQGGAQADSSQHCKNSIKKKKKGRLNCNTCSVTTDLIDGTELNVNKKSDIESPTSLQTKPTKSLKICEELSTRTKKTAKQKKKKADANHAEISDCKSKEKSEQSNNKENEKPLKFTNCVKTDVNSTLPVKVCETPEKKEAPKKRKKRNKAKKVIADEINIISEVAFSCDNDKTDPEVKSIKKQKKSHVKLSEQSVGNNISEGIKAPRSEENLSGTQLDNNYKRLSKSKRRHLRKKRILATLGLTGITQVKSVKSRKRKSNTSNICNEETEDSSSPSKDLNAKSLPKEVLDTKYQDKQLSEHLNNICERIELLSVSTQQHKTESVCEQIETKPIIEYQFECSDNTAGDLSISFCNFKDGDCVLNSSLCCGSSILEKAETSNTLKENINNSDEKLVEVKNLPTVNVKKDIEGSVTLSSKREETFSDKVNIPNFLSHDNVEGLFRSALLNDITLSSRCSEKEVKNFFNTYGTFSEKNRTQFAEVEKLLLSSNKLEDPVESSLFECEKSVTEIGQEKKSFDLIDSCVSASNSEIGLEVDKFCNSKETLRKQTEDQASYPNSLAHPKSCCSSNGCLNTSETAGLNKEVGWDPIYTSPNPENKVISSVNSPQIQLESKVSLSPLSSSFNCPLSSRPEKSESRLLEIVENVLLVHERVRDQLTSEKKLPSQRYYSNFSGTGLLSSSENKEDVLEKNSQTVKNKTSPVNSIPICNNSKVECASSEHDSQPLLNFDPTSNASRIRPLHECIPTVFYEDKVPDNISIKAEKIDIDSIMQKPEKTKELIKAEREAKKMAKMARKMKGTVAQDPSVISTSDGDATSLKNVVPSKSQETYNEPSVVVSSSSVGKVVDTAQKTVTKDTVSKKQSSNSGPHHTKGVDSLTEVDGEILKSKAELKAERRAIQEAQRAAKALQQQQLKQKPPQQMQQESKPVKSAAQLEKNTFTSTVVSVKSTAIKSSKPVELVGKEIIKSALLHKVKLFNHLYVKQEASVPKSISATSHLHPAVVRLGVQYATKVIVGSNARCLALLSAVKQVIEDYKTPPQKEFSRGLEAILQPSMAFLQECRPLSVSMTNAIKHIKWQMRHLPNNISDVDAKRKLEEAIDTYIREQIEVAGQAICNAVIDKISSGDIILTYGCSSLLQRILIKAHKSGTKFRVVIVDARPWREGKEMLRRLVENGLHCSYVVITAASFIMREATKVLLGAHALLANGYVMSRAGSSQVALLAHSYNVPVLVCCETHKFSERVQTDSIVYNELGTPEELVTADSCSKEHPLSKWKSINNLTPLNITYDVTPPDLVTAVVTELSILPCTSVPVILRIKPTESGC